MLLPLPVSPATTTTRCLLSVSRIKFLRANTGSCSRSLSSLLYFPESRHLQKRFLTASKFSFSTGIDVFCSSSSSPAKFSHESSGSSETLHSFSGLLSGCCSFNLFSNLVINWSLGLLDSNLFFSSLLFSASLHSSQTSRYVGGSS